MMPETYREIVNRVLRDHVGYTGDGQGGIGLLPIGDRSTARKTINNRDLREVLLAGETAVEAAQVAAADAEAARDEAVTAMIDTQGATLFAANLTALLGNTETSFPAGTIFATRAEGYSYQVVASDPDLTTAGGVYLRVLPDGDRRYCFGAWGPAMDGTTDDSAKLQLALDRIPTSGGVLTIPRGRLRLNSGVYRRLNASGALGWGLTIVGSSSGTTTIVVGFDDAAITLDGPVGSFAAGVNIHNLRFEPVNDGEGVAMRLRGIARSDFSIYAYRMRIAVDCEAFLINRLHIRAQECNVGINFRQQGYYSGDWGASGCNENAIVGDFGRCKQYGIIASNIRGLTLDAHVERCGDENIAGGGVSDLDRGGMKFVNPVGTLRLRGSSEDCGDVEDGQAGKGVLYVLTDGTVTQPWCVHLDGWNFFGTLDRPDHFINIAHAASAGHASIVLDGVSFSDHSSYVPNAAYNKIAISAPGKNVRVTMDGVTMTHADVEMTWNADTEYVVTNSPNIIPETARSQVYIRTGGGRQFGMHVTGSFTNAAIGIDGGQKIGLSTDGSVWLRYNPGLNEVQFGTGIGGSESVKHTISMG